MWWQVLQFVALKLYISTHHVRGHEIVYDMRDDSVNNIFVAVCLPCLIILSQAQVPPDVSTESIDTMISAQARCSSCTVGSNCIFSAHFEHRRGVMK